MTSEPGKSLLVWSIGGREFLARLLRKEVARALSRRRRKHARPLIACIPGDEIGDNVIAHGWYEDALLAAIFDGLLKHRKAQFASGVALDAGANIGNHSVWLSRVFSRVVSFEPNPICTRIFEANLLLNGISNVTLVPSGLGEQEARVSFHMDRGGNIGNSGVNKSAVRNAGVAFDVDLVVGDVVLTQEALAGLPVELLKIDVEGHELPALRGLTRILRTHQPIVLFESHGTTGPAGSDEVIRFLASNGLTHLYVIEPVRPRNKWWRALRRAVRGEQLVARKVDQLEDRTYSLVVASPNELLATHEQGR
jgi:FkbM family methyltransferase